MARIFQVSVFLLTVTDWWRGGGRDYRWKLCWRCSWYWCEKNGHEGSWRCVFEVIKLGTAFYFILFGQIDDSLGRAILLSDSLTSPLSAGICFIKPVLLEIGGLTLGISSVDHTYYPWISFGVLALAECFKPLEWKFDFVDFDFTSRSFLAELRELLPVARCNNCDH